MRHLLPALLLGLLAGCGAEISTGVPSPCAGPGVTPKACYFKPLPDSKVIAPEAGQ